MSDQSSIKIVEASFVAGATTLDALPPPAHVEIAFAGRSNVGKSSLINALLDRRGLVRVSSTPGSTRQINVYRARAADGAVIQLIDLPGYGYTKRSKSEQGAWRALIEGYLSSRVTLAAVVVIVDARRGVEEEERDLIAFLDEHANAARSRPPVTTVLVATKLDKLPKSEQKPSVARVAKSVARADTGPSRRPLRTIGFSSETGAGRAELWAALRAAFQAPSASADKPSE